MQYWAGLKLNSSIIFWGEKIRVFETKVAKSATWYSLSLIFLQFDWLNTPWNLIGYFVFGVASSLAGKKMQFEAKGGAIRK